MKRRVLKETLIDGTIQYRVQKMVFPFVWVTDKYTHATSMGFDVADHSIFSKLEDLKRWYYGDPCLIKKRDRVLFEEFKKK